MAEKLNLKNQKQGQSLLELVFAISIVGLLLAGFVSAIVYFSKTGQVSESGSKATQLAQEKIEHLRAEKNNSPADFWQNMDNNYLPNSPISEDLDGGKYQRITTYTDLTPAGENRKVQVEVVISWREQDQIKTAAVKTYFSQY